MTSVQEQAVSHKTKKVLHDVRRAFTSAVLRAEAANQFEYETGGGQHCSPGEGGPSFLSQRSETFYQIFKKDGKDVKASRTDAAEAMSFLDDFVDLASGRAKTDEYMKEQLAVLKEEYITYLESYNESVPENNMPGMLKMQGQMRHVLGIEDNGETIPLDMEAYYEDDKLPSEPLGAAIVPFIAALHEGISQSEAMQACYEGNDSLQTPEVPNLAERRFSNQPASPLAGYLKEAEKPMEVSKARLEILEENFTRYFSECFSHLHMTTEDVIRAESEGRFTEEVLGISEEDAFDLRHQASPIILLRKRIQKMEQTYGKKTLLDRFLFSNSRVTAESTRPRGKAGIDPIVEFAVENEDRLIEMVGNRKRVIQSMKLLMNSTQEDVMAISCFCELYKGDVAGRQVQLPQPVDEGLDLCDAWRKSWSKTNGFIKFSQLEQPFLDNLYRRSVEFKSWSTPSDTLKERCAKTWRQKPQEAKLAVVEKYLDAAKRSVEEASEPMTQARRDLQTWTKAVRSVMKGYQSVMSHGEFGPEKENLDAMWMKWQPCVKVAEAILQALDTLKELSLPHSASLCRLDERRPSEDLAYNKAGSACSSVTRSTTLASGSGTDGDQRHTQPSGQISRHASASLANTNASAAHPCASDSAPLSAPSSNVEGRPGTGSRLKTYRDAVIASPTSLQQFVDRDIGVDETCADGNGSGQISRCISASSANSTIQSRGSGGVSCIRVPSPLPAPSSIERPEAGNRWKTYSDAVTTSRTYPQHGRSGSRVSYAPSSASSSSDYGGGPRWSGQPTVPSKPMKPFERSPSSRRRARASYGVRAICCSPATRSMSEPDVSKSGAYAEKAATSPWAQRRFREPLAPTHGKRAMQDTAVGGDGVAGRDMSSLSEDSFRRPSGASSVNYGEVGGDGPPLLSASKHENLGSSI